MVGFIFIDSIGEWREMSWRTTNERPDLAVEEGAISLSLSLRVLEFFTSLLEFLNFFLEEKKRTIFLFLFFTFSRMRHLLSR